MDKRELHNIAAFSQHKHVCLVRVPDWDKLNADCSSCQASCQSACKTSCTVSNQPCPEKR